ncbi:MAG: hypothetical protein ACYS7Y_07745 [Planctomycetota bacterium]|jgi:predicted  nucleic acid-binding Zn-ribbon protein
MTQERIKCPFCSELILPDAIKCRFCGEWFSREEELIEEGSPGAGRGKQSRHGDERNPAEQRNSQESEIPLQNAEEKIEEVEEADNGYDDEDQEALGEPPVRVVSFSPVEDRLRCSSARRGQKWRIPWQRMILLIVYLGIAVAMGVSEFSARKALREAREKENVPDYGGAFVAYEDLVEAFPFSFAAIEATQSLHRLSDSREELEMPRPSWIRKVEDVLGELNDADVYLLPFVTWPACVVLLLLVSVTRIFRPVAAVLSFLLMIVAAAGSIAQFSWYGLIPLTPVANVAQNVMQLLTTALMTLTAASKPNSRPAR